MRIDAIKKIEQTELIAGLLSVLFIPINKQMVVVFMLLWLVTALFNFSWALKSGFKIDFLKKEFLAFAVLADFYLLHVIGMFYSKNLEYGFFDLEIKMSLFIVPLLIFVRSDFYADKLILFFKSLTLGIVFSFFINLSFAYLTYIEDGSRLNFYYSKLSSQIHPTYMALYVSLALLGMIYYNKKHQLFANKKLSLFVKIFVFVILVTYLFLLSSKAGIIAFSVALVMYVAMRLIKRLKLITVIIISIFLLVLPFLIVSKIPNVNMRFKEISMVFKNPEKSNIDSEYGSLVRMAIIKAGWELSVDNLPWGVGTGDVKDAIIDYHQQNGSERFPSNYLNAHNQFAQSTIALGVLGILFLSLFFVFGFVFAYRQKKLLLFVFMIMLFIHFLFESMFETQAGVVFIVLFYSLMLADERNLINSNPHLKK